MKKYKISLEIEAEIDAFDEDDARDYIGDIFGVDEEIKSIKISSIREK